MITLWNVLYRWKCWHCFLSRIVNQIEGSYTRSAHLRVFRAESECVVHSIKFRKAAEEKEEQLYANGDFHEALHGVLIGTEADR